MKEIKKYIRAVATIAMALFFSVRTQAQNDELGTWNVLNGEYYLTKKWTLWAELQTRSQKFFNEFFYHEVKGGFGYRPNKNIGLLMGFGQYGTYSLGGNFKSPVVNQEFRMWEQLTLVNNIDRVKLEHRYRIEQRWRTDGFRNRFRYRINPIIPINASSIQKGTWFVSIWDEIFLTDLAPHFERNRFFAGLGFQPSKTIIVQLGWLRQYDYSLVRNMHKDFLQTSVLLKFKRENNEQQVHPSVAD